MQARAPLRVEGSDRSVRQCFAALTAFAPFLRLVVVASSSQRSPS